MPLWFHAKPGFGRFLFGSAGRAAPRIARTAGNKNPAGAGLCLLPNPGGQGGNAGSGALRALMRSFRRLLWRAALFLWIRPRALKRSRIGWATAKAAWRRRHRWRPAP